MAKPKLNVRNKGLQDRAKDTVNFIIEATTQLLEEKGIKSLTTNKIVERAGISIGTLYQYFPNKESILHYLIEKSLTGLADDMVETIQKLDLNGVELKEAISMLLDRFFKNHETKKNVFGQFFSSLVSVEHLKFMLKNDDKIVKALKEKFMPYNSELNLKDWDQTIFIMLYALKGIQFGILFGNPHFEHKNLKEEVAKMMYQFLKAPK